MNEALTAERLAVYDALLRHGPQTSAELAANTDLPAVAIRGALIGLDCKRLVRPTSKTRGGLIEWEAMTRAQAQAVLRADYAATHYTPPAEPAPQPAPKPKPPTEQQQNLF